MINCLSPICHFRLFICSFKAVTIAQLLFKHFYSVSVVKSSEVSVLGDAPFVTITSRFLKMLTNSESHSGFIETYLETVNHHAPWKQKHVQGNHLPLMNKTAKRNYDTHKAHCTSFPLKVSSVNVTKSAGICGFDQIYWRNP